MNGSGNPEKVFKQTHIAIVGSAFFTGYIPSCTTSQHDYPAVKNRFWNLPANCNKISTKLS